MINRIAGLEALLRDWDSDPDSSRVLPMRRGPLGHVNLTGNPDDPAITFSPRHPQFLASIEAGVRELVVRLIRRLGCVTYSSCEGHLSADGRRVACPRHVAIVCRSTEEYERIRSRLGAVVAKLDDPRQHVALVLCDELLETDTGTLRSIGLSFLPIGADSAGYFRELDQVYSELLHHLPSC